MSTTSRSEKEEFTLEEIRDKFEATKGVLIWGKTAAGVKVEVLVDDDGKLETT